jgi:hypothetical protein
VSGRAVGEYIAEAIGGGGGTGGTWTPEPGSLMEKLNDAVSEEDGPDKVHIVDLSNSELKHGETLALMFNQSGATFAINEEMILYETRDGDTRTLSKGFNQRAGALIINGEKAATQEYVENALMPAHGSLLERLYGGDSQEVEPNEEGQWSNIHTARFDVQMAGYCDKAPRNDFTRLRFSDGA